jgi:hypothetical protein
LSLLDHLEQHCGTLDAGFSGLPSEFQVIQLPRGPIEGTRVLATLGLSRHVMHSASSGKEFRIELVMLFRDHEGPQNLPGVLHQAGMEALRAHHGVVRGDVIGPKGPLRERATVEALYASVPTYFDESFHHYDPADGSLAVVIVWLVPITATEAHFVRRVGWRVFESELEEQDPDLLDFERDAIVFP